MPTVIRSPIHDQSVSLLMSIMFLHSRRVEYSRRSSGPVRLHQGPTCLELSEVLDCSLLWPSLPGTSFSIRVSWSACLALNDTSYSVENKYIVSLVWYSIFFGCINRWRRVAVVNTMVSISGVALHWARLLRGRWKCRTRQCRTASWWTKWL